MPPESFPTPFLELTDIKKIAEFLIYSNTWIALGAASLVFFFYRNIGLPPDGLIIAFVFLSTLFTYTFQRFAKIKSLTAFSGPRMEWMTGRIRSVAATLAISGLAICILLFFMRPVVFLVLIPFGLISVLYVGKFPFRDFFNLRDIPFLKAHLIAAVWVGACIALPVVHSQPDLTTGIFVLAAAVYAFIFALAIAFDIRDMEVDEPEKRTVPQVLGKDWSVALAVFCNGGAQALTVYVNPQLVIPCSIFFLLSSLMILNALWRKDDLYYSFWLDGQIVLFGLLGCFA